MVDQPNVVCVLAQASLVHDLSLLAESLDKIANTHIRLLPQPQAQDPPDSIFLGVIGKYSRFSCVLLLRPLDRTDYQVHPLYHG
ncbi:hypothetical protein D3C71_1868300 [compost metagenome]